MLEQYERDNAVRAASAKANAQVEAKGRCLFCSTPLKSGLRWCDAHCRDDWQKENPKL